MKAPTIKSATFSNKKKQIELTYSSGKIVNVHFGNLGIKQNVKEIWVDLETKGRSLGIRLSDGAIDYMPYDQPLAIVRDPDFILQNHIEKITAQIKEEIKKKRISKKFLAKELKTSDNQVQRLLNPNILNKNLSQLYKIAALLSLEVHIQLQQVA